MDSFLESGSIKITDDMVFAPAMVYIPSAELLTFMINRAANSVKDSVTGTYGFMF